MDGAEVGKPELVFIESLSWGRKGPPRRHPQPPQVGHASVVTSKIYA